MNKKLLYLASGAVAIAAAGTFALGTAFAAPATTQPNPMANLVTAIAQKFNLNVADVQQVFNDQKTQIHASMQQKFTDRLNQLVSEGKLTQDQVNKITVKKAELESQRASFMASLEGKSKADVQAALKAQMDSLRQWATDNNIPLQYIMFGGKGGLGHKFHGLKMGAKMMGMGN